MLTFLSPDEAEKPQDAARVARCVAALVDGGRRALLIQTIDGDPPSKKCAMGEALLEAGFVAGARGWMKRQKHRSWGSDPLDEDELPS
jgi:hypothetical protein